MKVRIEKVLEDREGFAAISEESPFYPDGKGGQLGDRGRIGDAMVKRVIQKKDGIYHILDREIKPGEHEVVIDENRRRDIAVQHTAQHILSAALVKVADIETVSFHMGEDFSTIDLNAAPILKEVLEEAEELANQIVWECRPVIEHLVSREEARIFPLRKPISEKVKGTVRIIEVKDFDWNACAGFHVKNTGEIGMIKIIDYEKVKGSLTRVYFVAGKRALREFSKRVDLIRNLSSILTTSVDEMQRRIENLLSDVKEKSADLEKISEEFSKLLAPKLLKEAKEINGVRVIFYDGFESVGRYLFKYLGDEEGAILFVKVEGGYEIGSASIDVGKLIETLLEKLEGRGGGGKKRGRLQTAASVKALEEALRGIL